MFFRKQLIFGTLMLGLIGGGIQQVQAAETTGAVNTATSNSISIDSWMPDKALQTAVSQQLKITVDQLTPAKMAELTTLNIEREGITSLQGLQYATNLTKLLAGLNDISDLTPLAKLKNLTDLQIYGNDITDLKPIKNLKKLTILNLASNEITNIAPLKGLTKLQYLLLNNIRTTTIDLKQLVQLSALSYLNLNNDAIKNSKLLGKLTKLTWLSLAGSDVKRITFLQTLTNLKLLDLTNNKISDITAIKKLTKLTDLSLGLNQISNIKPLAKLTKLESLSLGINKITSVNDLANLVKLQKLYLDVNNIHNINKLKKLKNLRQLAIEQNALTDIAVLKNMPKLTELSASKQNVVLPIISIAKKQSLVQPLKILNNQGILVVPTLDTRIMGAKYSVKNKQIMWGKLTKNGEVDSSWTSNITYGTNQTTNFSGTIVQPIQIRNSKQTLGVLKVYQAKNNTTSMADKYVKKTVTITKITNNKYRVLITLVSPQSMGKQPISLVKVANSKAAPKLISAGHKVGANYETTYQLFLQKKNFNKPLPANIHVEFTNPFKYKANYDIRLLIQNQSLGTNKKLK